MPSPAPPARIVLTTVANPGEAARSVPRQAGIAPKHTFRASYWPEKPLS
jgi:hypothetical protein